MAKTMDKDALVDALSELTVLEMAELKTALEDKWGVKAAAAAATVVAAAPADGGGAAAEEATDFEVILAEKPEKTMPVIKVVRDVTGLGLKESKDLVEGAPKTLKDSAPKEEAEEIKKKVEEAGGKVELKGL